MTPDLGHGIQILVVSASETVLSGLASLLASVGYVVQGVSDAWSARKVLTARRIDLVLIHSAPLEDALVDLVRFLGQYQPAIHIVQVADVPTAVANGSLLERVARLVGTLDPGRGGPPSRAA